jgi:hypothetical protein
MCKFAPHKIQKTQNQSFFDCILVALKQKVKTKIIAGSEYEYYCLLADLLNVAKKHTKPAQVIKGRELELFCHLALASDRFPTLSGAGFKEWLKESGGFTANDIYRYMSSLKRKGWIVKRHIQYLQDGTARVLSNDTSGIEAYVLPPFFDKKKAGLTQKLEFDVFAGDSKTKSMT